MFPDRLLGGKIEELIRHFVVGAWAPGKRARFFSDVGPTGPGSEPAPLLARVCSRAG